MNSSQKIKEGIKGQGIMWTLLLYTVHTKKSNPIIPPSRSKETQGTYIPEYMNNEAGFILHTNHVLWSCCMTICQVPFSFYIFTQRSSDYFVQTPDTHTPCRVGSVGSMSASRTVGREFASRPGHTKDHHKNGTNCLPAWHAMR